MAEDLTGTQAQKPKKKMNGCLLAFLIFLGVVILGTAIIGYVAYRGVKSVKDKFVEEYADGFESHTGQTMTIEDQTGDHLYLAQNVVIKGNTDGNLAFLVQNATIVGNVTGDIASTSQVLTIEEDAVVGGDIYFIGQALVIAGEVKGTIEGSAQSVTIREDLANQVQMEYQSIQNIPYDAPIEETGEIDSIDIAADTLEIVTENAATEIPDAEEAENTDNQ